MSATATRPPRTTVALEPDHLRHIYAEGRRRDEARSWSRNYTIDREQTHIRGLKGELAVAEYYGLAPDLSERPDGDAGIDFEAWWWLYPVAIDVKTTQYRTDPWLRVRADGHDAADVYVLTAVDGTEVDLVGWASRADVRAVEPSRETGHHENHVLDAAALRPLPDPEFVDALDGERGVER